MQANVSADKPLEEQIAQLMAVIGQPARISILLVMRSLPTCVCHLETVLGMRQASISQHLMLLRKAGVVVAQRDGRHIFYRMADERLLGVLYQAAALCNIPAEKLDALSHRPQPGCPCPYCKKS